MVVKLLVAEHPIVAVGQTVEQACPLMQSTLQMLAVIVEHADDDEDELEEDELAEDVDVDVVASVVVLSSLLSSPSSSPSSSPLSSPVDC